MPTNDEVRQQSINAITQWGDQWRRHATYHSKYQMHSLDDFKASGVGKACLLIANGYSFEANIETIRKNQHNVDILCCDKTLGHCLENGITPTYCLVADANVPFDKYLRKWKDQLSEVILFQNVCGNPEWTDKGNWKEKYFFINKDILRSEIEFSKLSGCPNVIPAGTNVSNAMLIILTQCEKQRRNFFGYDNYLLIGFDYSWTDKGKYYSFSESGDGKADYMRHMFMENYNGDSCYTSNNLFFSVRWLEQYITAYGLTVTQCTKHSILKAARFGDLEKQMQYEWKREDSPIVQMLQKELMHLKQRENIILKRISEIELDHTLSFLRSS